MLRIVDTVSAPFSDVIAETASDAPAFQPLDLDCGALVRSEGDARIVGLEKLQFAFAQLIARRTRLANSI
jgi:hypothetical protein